MQMAVGSFFSVYYVNVGTLRTPITASLLSSSRRREKGKGKQRFTPRHATLLSIQNSKEMDISIFLPLFPIITGEIAPSNSPPLNLNILLQL
jgi:hypothetical protein